jgi:hypothetical protein
MPVPRPLYRLPELLDAERVFVTEGEKAADALRELGLVATTSPHGSASAAKSDWSPLAGKECIVLPDNDDAGRRYAQDVERLLKMLAPTPTVKIVELPDLPLHGDAVEYIDSRRAAGQKDEAIRDGLISLASAAEPIDLDRPAPLAMEFLPFPVDVMPSLVTEYINTVAGSIGCDQSFVAVPLLAVFAAAIGNSRRIQLKLGWDEPSILWTVIVGESGTQKTPAFRIVLRPLRELQSKAMREHAEIVERYRRKLLECEKDLACWKRSKDKVSDPPEKPEEPQPKRFLVSDTTVEALALLLSENRRGLLLARDELGGWIRSFDRYARGKGGDSAHFLSMHVGEEIIVDRKSASPGVLHVPRASVSITGGIQPGILRRALGTEHFESGLAARLLLAYPRRRCKRWTDQGIAPEVEARVTVVIDRLMELRPDAFGDEEPEPVIVPLTPAGRRTWIEFYNVHAQRQVDLTGALAAAWSKLEGYAARLALVIHFVRWAAEDPTLATPRAVDEISVTAGVKLARWFGNEAERVYAALAESDDDRDRRELVELIERKGGSVSVRDWQRARSRKTAADAEAELEALVDGGYGQWHFPPQTGRGRPTKLFFLSSDTSDTDRNRDSGKESPIVSVSGVSDVSNGTSKVDAIGAVDDEWGEL